MPYQMMLCAGDLRLVNDRCIDVQTAARLLVANMPENAAADLAAQANPDADWEGLQARYPNLALGDFDGDPSRLTEMDALVAYLQMLGTLVDFTAYDAEANFR